MAQRLVILVMVAVLLAGHGWPALAQGGEAERPPCTAADVEPVSRLVIAMIDSLGQGGLSVDDQLRWRAEIAALDVTNCAGMRDALVQLHLAADELLIGALLLERAADPSSNSAADTAALAINNGLTALVGMRFALRDTPAPADNSPDASLGDLDGEAVLAAFRAAGLPVGEVTRPDAPASAALIAQIDFSLTGLPEGEGGQILVFASAAGRDSWLADLLSEEAEPGYLVLHRNVVVRLSPALDGATARQFRATLRGIE